MVSLEKRIHTDLDNAREGGYVEILGWPAASIALDLQNYSDGYQNFTVEYLVPHIETWLKKNT